MSEPFAGGRRRVVVLVATFVLMVASALPAPAAQSTDTVNVIVTFKPGVAAASNASTTAIRHNADVNGVFTRVFSGFAAEVPVDRVDDLASEPSVASVEYDLPVQISGDPNLAVGESTGADRVNLEHLLGYLSEARVDGDIAIIDTGVNAAHADLNVAGGVDCTTGTCATVVTPTDPHGHGTHVAGIAAAYAGGSGVTGIAPGARIWSVRVLDENGSGLTSSIIAGLDWITTRNDIEVANMSLSGLGSLDSTFRTAVQAATAAGVVIVDAAGNNSTDAAAYTPAVFPETITVSSISDSDGNPYGLGAPCNGTPDDTFSSFSNFGSVVDIAAPGGCIRSTYLGGYASMSGTSMAAPHVAGAALRWIVANNVAANADRTATVRAAILTEWTVPAAHACGYSGTRSGEPLLMLSPCDQTVPTMGAITATPGTDEATISFAAATDAAGIAGYQLDYTGREAVSWASLGTYSTVPTEPVLHQEVSGPATIDYRLTALDWEGNTATITASATIADNTGPTLAAPSTSVDGHTVTLTWTAATDPSGVGRVELWRTVDAGTLTLHQTLAADAFTYSDANLERGHTYRYQLKGVDTLGNVTTTAEATAVVALPDTTGPTLAAPSASVDGQTVILTWTAATDPSGVDRVELWRTLDDGTLTLYRTLASDASTFTDTNLEGGHTYRYLLKGHDTPGNVTSTAEATADVVAPAPVPAPSGGGGGGGVPPAPPPAEDTAEETDTDAFTDVAETSPFADDIRWLTSQGITVGCGDQLFCPTGAVTRGEMAVFLTRALDLESGSSTFSDVVGHPYAAAIASIADAGISIGVDDTRFDPESPVTRGQMAVFISRALGLPAGTATFVDVVDHPYADAIASIADAGITLGVGDGRFAPDAPITREQMAAFLRRALEA